MINQLNVFPSSSLKVMMQFHVQFSDVGAVILKLFFDRFAVPFVHEMWLVVIVSDQHAPSFTQNIFTKFHIFCGFVVVMVFVYV